MNAMTPTRRFGSTCEATKKRQKIAIKPWNYYRKSFFSNIRWFLTNYKRTFQNLPSCLRMIKTGIFCEFDHKLNNYFNVSLYFI